MDTRTEHRVKVAGLWVIGGGLVVLVVLVLLLLARRGGETEAARRASPAAGTSFAPSTPSGEVPTDPAQRNQAFINDMNTYNLLDAPMLRGGQSYRMFPPTVYPTMVIRRASEDCRTMRDVRVQYMVAYMARLGSQNLSANVATYNLEHRYFCPNVPMK